MRFVKSECFARLDLYILCQIEGVCTSAYCRYASFKAVIASKKKPIEQVSAAELGLTCPPQLRTVLVEQPEPRQGGRLVSNVHELVDFLAEQKVL